MTNQLGSVRQTNYLKVETEGAAGAGGVTDHTTGIIAIVVVCCVIGTSCVWVWLPGREDDDDDNDTNVFIIYQVKNHCDLR